jgi:hypothetical protein
MEGKWYWILVIIAAIGASILTYKATSSYYDSRMFSLKNEVAIYKSQSNNYAKVIKTIKEATESATPVAMAIK